MITQVIPGFDLAGFEVMAFERQTEYTGDKARRLGVILAEVICRTFTGTDQELLAKQIESDFLDWASRTGRFVYSPGNRTPPRVSPERRAELAGIAEQTKTRWGLK